MTQADVIAKVFAVFPLWRQSLRMAQNLSKESLDRRIAKGELLQEPLFTSLCNILSTEADRLVAAADTLDEIRESLVPAVLKAQRYADRVVMSAETLAKWKSPDGLEDAHFLNDMARMNYTFDGENWSRPREPRDDAPKSRKK